MENWKCLQTTDNVRLESLVCNLRDYDTNFQFHTSFIIVCCEVVGSSLSGLLPSSFPTDDLHLFRFRASEQASWVNREINCINLSELNSAFYQCKGQQIVQWNCREKGQARNNRLCCHSSIHHERENFTPIKVHSVCVRYQSWAIYCMHVSVDVMGSE